MITVNEFFGEIERNLDQNKQYELTVLLAANHGCILVRWPEWDNILENSGLYVRPLAEIENHLKALKDQIGKGEKE